jgi:hypothetical protein
MVTVICGCTGVPEKRISEIHDFSRPPNRVNKCHDMNVSGFLKVLSPMIVRSMHKELKKSLGNLKQILEA